MTSERAASELDEQLSHRGLIALRLQDVVRATLGDGYTVRSVFADQRTDQVYLVVIHPHLPPVAPGAQAPVLNDQARYVMQYHVVPAEDDPQRMELWQRPVITIASPEQNVKAPAEVMSPLWLEIGVAPDLEDLLGLLRSAAERPDAPRLATDFLDWLQAGL